nr:hypothetical protein BaRGS_032017 [Batillaria attramentaria]
MLDDFTVFGGHGDQFLAVARETFSDPVIFRLDGSSKDMLPGNQKPMSSHPETFKGKNLTATIADLTKDVGVDDDKDPDSDVEIVTPPDSDEEEQEEDIDDDEGIDGDEEGDDDK